MTKNAKVQTVEIGELTLSLSKLKLGVIRHDAELHAAVQTLVTTGATAMKTVGLPTPEQLDMMVTIVAAAARQNDATVTRDAISAALDDVPFDDGFKVLGDACGVAIYDKTLTLPPGMHDAGEAPSPSASISIESTGG